MFCVSVALTFRAGNLSLLPFCSRSAGKHRLEEVQSTRLASIVNVRLGYRLHHARTRP